MDSLVTICSYLYPHECCHNILIDFNILEEECLKTVISKTVGYGIIFGSTLVKLPQLIKIVSAASGVGLSFTGVLFELMAMTFAVSYAIAKQFPFSAWGESLFLLFVTAIIAVAILYYELNRFYSIAFITCYSVIFYSLVSGFTPFSILWSLQATNMPLVLIGKLLQAFTNLKNGHTGQLSAITIVLLLLGSVARIFTSIRETGDNLVVFTFIAASFANSVLLFQLVYYWNETIRFLDSQNKNKKKKL